MGPNLGLCELTYYLHHVEGHFTGCCITSRLLCFTVCSSRFKSHVYIIQQFCALKHSIFHMHQSFLYFIYFNKATYTQQPSFHDHFILHSKTYSPTSLLQSASPQSTFGSRTGQKPLFQSIIKEKAENFPKSLEFTGSWWCVLMSSFLTLWEKNSGYYGSPIKESTMSNENVYS